MMMMMKAAMGKKGQLGQSARHLEIFALPSPNVQHLCAPPSIIEPHCLHLSGNAEYVISNGIFRHKRRDYFSQSEVKVETLK